MNVVFLVGSPKPAGSSTSEALGAYLVDQLTDAQVETFHAHKVLRTSKFTAQYLAALDQADLFVVSFPVYIDTLPYVLQRVFEITAAHRLEHPPAHKQRMACVSNCGFPEAAHTELSLRVCAAFAEETGFVWSGGVGLGEGGVVDGVALEERGGVTLRLRQSLDAVAAHLSQGEPISEAAAEGVAVPLIPRRLYTLAGTVGWHVRARGHEVMRKLRNQPYT